VKLIEGLGLKDRVTLVGEVSDPSDFLQTIAIYVSASEGEGLPYAILEAIAAQKPIVASKVPGHTDLLPDSCLFTDDFAQKISRADQQDVNGLRHTIILRNDLPKALSRIAQLY